METEHGTIIREIGKQFKTVMDSSPQGVYLWLDDEHKICNEHLAEMFGYTVSEWQESPSFLEGCVAEADREKFARNFQNHIETLDSPMTFRFLAIMKDGGVFSAEADMIPISWDNHAVAYHFVRKIT